MALKAVQRGNSGGQKSRKGSVEEEVFPETERQPALNRNYGFVVLGSA